MILTTVEELKAAIPVTTVFEMKDINPFLPKAERYVIKKVLGQPLYDELLAAYDAETLSVYQEALLVFVQAAVANTAYLAYIPHAQVVSSKDGMHITASDQKKTAFKYQILDIKREVCESANEAMEAALNYLEANVTEFATWVDSPAYTEFYECIITNAEMFSRHSNINDSRITFRSFKYLLLRAQQTLLIPVMGQAFFDEFIDEIKSGDIESNQLFLDLYKFIGPAMCNQVVADAMIELPVTITEYGTQINFYKEYALDATETKNERDDRNAKRTACIEVARKAVQDLQEYLYQNVDDYTTYGASDEYADLLAQREAIAPGTIPGSTYIDDDHTDDPTIDSHIINFNGGISII